MTTVSTKVILDKEYYDVDIWEDPNRSTMWLKIKVTAPDGRQRTDWQFMPAWWWLARRKAFKMAKQLAGGARKEHYRLYRERG